MYVYTMWPSASNQMDGGPLCDKIKSPNCFSSSAVKKKKKGECLNEPNEFCYFNS